MLQHPGRLLRDIRIILAIRHFNNQERQLLTQNLQSAIGLHFASFSAVGDRNPGDGAGFEPLRFPGSLEEALRSERLARVVVERGHQLVRKSGEGYDHEAAVGVVVDSNRDQLVSIASENSGEGIHTGHIGDERPHRGRSPARLPGRTSLRYCGTSV